MAAATVPPPTSVGQSDSDVVNDFKKYFTITATLRETYDDNIFTAKTGKVSSLETDLAPSILVDVPTDGGDFSARYTFDVTYYNERSGGSLDMQHEFLAQYRHSFSDRFGFNVAEDFRYFTEPSLLDSIGTNFRNGAYIANTINSSVSAQWTPLFSTLTTYANTIVKYEDGAIATEQDNMENTGTQSFSFAVLPKINLVVGGIVDNITYDDIQRGYTSYTGDGGLDWQALPSLTMGGRVGGTITDTDQSGSSVTPYASFTLGWQLGARSSLTFNYSHEIVPSDVVNSQGQLADRFDTTFKYDVTPDITVHLEGIFTHGQYTEDLLTPGTGAAFEENDYALDLGAAYHVNTHFDIETGYDFSGVDSGENFRDYTRNQVYVGVRGTY